MEVEFAAQFEPDHLHTFQNIQVSSASRTDQNRVFPGLLGWKEFTRSSRPWSPEALSISHDTQSFGHTLFNRHKRREQT
jgi:hypothetical protein